jgi:UDP-glucose:glycoprotein glucosyltransferase
MVNLQKEPKLARARQIPEWEEYDTEIAQFTRQLAKEGKIHSRMATADANVLAGGGNAATAEGDKPGEVTEATVSESENAHVEKVEGEQATSELERDEL